MPEPILKFDDVHTYYGALHVLKGVNYDLYEGEIVCLLGGNASGKSTTMKTVLGLVKPSSGQVIYRGERIDRLDTSQIIERGIAVVPEARRIFPRMTVTENLELGAFTRRKDRDAACADLDRVLQPLPAPARAPAGRSRHALGRRAADAGDGSRADESARSSCAWTSRRWAWRRNLVDQVFDVIQEINRQGTTIFVVEQNANMALSIAHRGFVLQTGRWSCRARPPTCSAPS